MAKVILFGTADLASLAHYYLKTDSSHEPVAFCVTQDFLKESKFEGLPVVALEEVAHAFSPSGHQFFVPMTQKRNNKLREEIWQSVKAKGYGCISYVSSKATVFSNVNIGENCFILEDNTLQPFVQIGNNVVLWSGNHIGHHSVIRDSVFFTSHVVLSGHCVVEKYCFFGVNATIRDGLHLAEGTFVGMGASLTRDSEPWGVYKGTSARPDGAKSQDLLK